ncbi:Hsp70 protein-domain-containing protein [Syncephalis plumigaleata]|nr:Hsp70 protein-domain-containing protein [Syncephalis plumigaleata]
MRVNAVSLSALLAGLTATVTLSGLANAAAVVGIDYGQEWYKVALVKRGIPLDLVLNRDSKRKTASVLTLRNGERSYGSDALSLVTRYPTNTFRELKQIFGRSFDDQVCHEYREAHVNHMVPVSNTTVAFRLEEQTDPSDPPYTVAELVAMQLEEANRQASATANEPVRDCVIAVPSYFSPTERQTIIDAAELANFRVLQVINDGAAVALNYAMSRSFNETPEYHIMFDMGAASTTVTVASYRSVSVKDVGKYLKNVPQVQIHGLAYNRYLGGGTIDQRLRQHLVKLFTESVKGVDKPIESDPRSMNRLLKEATRVKQILSANQETAASVEGLHEGHDFRAKVSRETLENIMDDMPGQVTAVVNEALMRAGIPLSNIQSILLMGGGTRVPLVQAALKELVGDRIAQGINSDEAVAMGAAFRGAGNLRQLRVKEILFKDMVYYPIQLVYRNEPLEGEAQGKQKTITLYKRGATTDVEKTVTFPHKHDFEFEANYAPYADDKFVGSTEILRAKVTGVAEALVVPETHKLLEGKVKVTLKIGAKGELVIEEAFVQLELESIPEEKSDDKANNKEETKEGESKEKKDDKPKKEQRRVKLNVQIESKAQLGLSEETRKQAQERMAALNEADKQHHLLEEARDGLESFVYRIRDLLDDEAYRAVSTDAIREGLQQKLSEISDWIYDDGSTAGIDVFHARLEELRQVHDPIFARRREHLARPDAVKALEQAMEKAEEFVKGIKETAEELRYHTEAELTDLATQVDEARAWIKRELDAQTALATDAEPTLWTKDIKARTKQLKDALKTLVKKPRPPKPASEPKAETEKNADDTSDYESTNNKQEETKTETNEPVNEDQKKSDKEPADETSAPTSHDEL